MKYFFLAFFLFPVWQKAFPQCKIAIDKTDEFDSTRLIAAEPVKIGFLIPTENLTEDIDGQLYTDEAKAIFSYAEGMDDTRSFFLTLAVVDRKFFMIGKGPNVWLKFDDGTIVELFNVPADAEFDRDLLMWKYLHTCVVPLEVFYQLKNSRVERIRILYAGYKSTIALEEKQQVALLDAVQCVEERLRNDAKNIRP